MRRRHERRGILFTSLFVIGCSVLICAPLIGDSMYSARLCRDAVFAETLSAYLSGYVQSVQLLGLVLCVMGGVGAFYALRACDVIDEKAASAAAKSSTDAIPSAESEATEDKGTVHPS